MIHTDRAIVVEGKYDKIKLSGMIDGVIVCTGGFRIYKDKESRRCCAPWQTNRVWRC